MTAPRLRAGRSRLLVGIGIFIFMIGVVAIFNSSQKELDKSKQLTIKCEQQQESSNARMQAIIEHKFRLEKSLESERKQHLETRHNLEKKIKELKDIHSKVSMDLNVRFNSLQQHFKILQSEHNDLIEESSKTKSSQSDLINGLEGKSKSLQSQLQLAKNQHDKDIEHWKIMYESSLNEKEHFKNLLQVSAGDDNIDSCKLHLKSLQLIVDEYQTNCEYQLKSKSSDFNITNPLLPVTYKDTGFNHPLDKPAIQKSFKEQKLVSSDLYEIPIKITNNNKSAKANNTTFTSSTFIKNDISKQLDKIGDGDIQQVNSILLNRKKPIGSMINSVENFQIIPNPIIINHEEPIIQVNNNVQQAPPLNFMRSSSTVSNEVRPIGDEMNRRALSFASPSSPASEKIKRSSTTANSPNQEALGRLKSKQIALGVAPIPDNFEQLIHNDDNISLNNKQFKHKYIASIENTANNRYANAVNDLSGKNNEGEMDNAAHEVKDADFNLGLVDDKNNMQDVLDNAAEDDTNNFFDEKILNKKDHGELEDGDTLNNEVVGDQGKEPELPDGIHLEEMNEGDEDEDDYSNLAARQQVGQAIRI